MLGRRRNADVRHGHKLAAIYGPTNAELTGTVLGSWPVVIP
jgi:hypothetical protein